MVRLTIPQRNPKSSKRRVNLKEGDLVLLVTLSGKALGHGQVTQAILGIFDGLCSERGKTLVKLRRIYKLRRCNSFGGQPVRLIEEPKASWLKNNSKYQVMPGLELYVEDEIPEKLRSWPGMEPHADWVGKLEKPYIR